MRVDGTVQGMGLCAIRRVSTVSQAPWGAGAEVWGEQAAFEVCGSPGCRGKDFPSWGGDSRSRGISSEYLGTDLCKELRIY